MNQIPNFEEITEAVLWTAQSRTPCRVFYWFKKKKNTEFYY